MRKSRYYVAFFQSCDLKNSLAKLSRHVLDKVEYSFQALERFADESHGQSPRRTWYDMIRNNENLFSPGLSRLSASPSTSCEVPSSRESASPMKAESGSSILPTKQLTFGTTKDFSESANFETEATIVSSQESVESCEETEMFSSSAKDDKMKRNPTEETDLSEESAESIEALMKRNLVKITSMSIIRQMEDVGVELDIDRIQNLSEELGQSSAGRKGKSTSSSPMKSGKLRDKPSFPSKSPLNVDYSDREFLKFIAKRLSHMLSGRKKYMKQIYNSFLEFQSDTLNFYYTIDDIKFVVGNFPIKNEKYFTEDLEKNRNNLINIANKILKKLDPIVGELDKEIYILEQCVQEINNFDEVYGLPLFEINENVLDVTVLKRLQSNLKLICSKADGIVILGDDKANVSKLSQDFEYLIKNFVKFMIITGILTPRLNLCSEDGKEK